MSKYNFLPGTKVELKELVTKLINERGNDANLNDIDTSLITNMNCLFWKSKFNGDISEWNVSNVENMVYMFYGSQFNQDISKWNVSNVTDMRWIFGRSTFNQDISKWDVRSIVYASSMFDGSKFNQDISNLIRQNPKILDGINEDSLIYEKVKLEFPEYFL